MQSCDMVQNLIEPYLDGELDNAEKESFLEHISSCPECEEALALAISVRSALSELPHIEVPADFGDKLHERVQKEQQSRRNIITYSRRFGALAACVVIAVAVNAGNLSKKNHDKAAPESSGDFVDAQVNNAVPFGAQADNAPELEDKKEESVKSTPAKDKDFRFSDISAADNSETVITQSKPKQPSVQKNTDIAEQTDITESDGGGTVPRNEEEPPAAEQYEADLGNAKSRNADESGIAAASLINGAETSEDNSEDNVEDKSEAITKSAKSAAASDVIAESDKVMPSSITAATGGASGGGTTSGSSAKSTTAVGVITVPAEFYERACQIAAEYKTPQNGVYRMNRADFESFIAALKNDKIVFSNRTSVDDTISFIIEID